MPEEEPSSLSVLEERIAAEEEVICERLVIETGSEPIHIAVEGTNLTGMSDD